MNGLPRQLKLGDHCCQFFETAQDLGDLLVPYFIEGLERNEACIWVTSEPYGKERAVSEMRSAANSFEKRYARGQIEFFSHDEWYLRGGYLDIDSLIPRWLGKKSDAITAGYTGLRLTGNVSFVEPEDWPAFMAYERAVTQAFQDEPVAAVCSYCLARCDAERVVEAIDSHVFSLRKRQGHWDVFSLRDDHLTAHLQGMQLRDLVEDRLSVCARATLERVSIDGARVLLSAQQSRDLGLVFNELVTKSAKHGALSVPEGRLDVSWRVILNGARRLQVEWVEYGPNNLLAQDQRDFRAHLMAESVERWTHIFHPAGLVCRFEVALD